MSCSVQVVLFFISIFAVMAFNIVVIYKLIKSLWNYKNA